MFMVKTRGLLGVCVKLAIERWCHKNEFRLNLRLNSVIGSTKLLGHKCKTFWLRLAMLQVSLQLSPCFDIFFWGRPKNGWPILKTDPVVGQLARVKRPAELRFAQVGFGSVSLEHTFPSVNWFGPQKRWQTSCISATSSRFRKKKGSLFRLSFIMTSDVIHLLKHCKYIVCVYIYIYMCVCLMYYTIILYVYIYIYKCISIHLYIYIYIPLYSSCGKPTLHAPRPGCHSGRRRIGAETWHRNGSLGDWFLRRVQLELFNGLV